MSRSDSTHAANIYASRPPLARAFVSLGKLPILVILEMLLARLLDLTPLEVLAELAFGVIEEVVHLVRQAILFPAISIGSVLPMFRRFILVRGRPILSRLKYLCFLNNG